MTKQEILQKINELRKQYTTANREDQKLITARAKLLKYALQKKTDY